MTHFTFSLFADLMFWGSIPLFGTLGIWEHHLELTDTDHKLVQIALVVIMFGWAYVWNSLGERDRLIHPTKVHTNRPKSDMIRYGAAVPAGLTSIIVKDGRHLDASSETGERYHVSDN